MKKNNQTAQELQAAKPGQEAESCSSLSASDTALRLIGYLTPIIGLIMAIIKTIRLKDTPKRNLAIASLLARPFVLFFGCTAYTVFYIVFLILSEHTAG